jgi:exosortase H (IPTLxxWG-CTERM-specific)
MPVPDPSAQMRRFLILVPLCLLVGFGLLQVPPVASVVNRFTGSLVTVSGALIHFFGGKATVIGSILQSPLGFSVKVENGCNAVNVSILLWAAILTYPAPWLQKLKGLAAGTVALHTVNLLRIISLFYLGQYSQIWFDFAHYYLWESLIVLDTLVIFWLWAVLVRKARPLPNAPAI